MSPLHDNMCILLCASHLLSLQSYVISLVYASVCQLYLETSPVIWAIYGLNTIYILPGMVNLRYLANYGL